MRRTRSPTDGPSPVNRDQRAGAREIARVAVDALARAFDARGDARRHARMAPSARIRRLVQRRAASDHERIEPRADLLHGALELHGDAGRRAHLRHLARHDVHDLAVDAQLLLAERQHDLDAHRLAQLERLDRGDEHAAVHEILDVLAAGTPRRPRTRSAARASTWPRSLRGAVQTPRPARVSAVPQPGSTPVRAARWGRSCLPRGAQAPDGGVGLPQRSRARLERAGPCERRKMPRFRGDAAGARA